MNFNMKEPRKRKGVLRLVRFIQCWNDNNGIFAYIKTNCPEEIMMHEWETFKSETNNIDYATTIHRWDFDSFKKESKVSDMVWNIFLQVGQWIVTF